jgi:hypothetical protein
MIWALSSFLKLTTTHTPSQSNSLWKQSVSPSSSIKETDKIKPKIAQHKNTAIFGFFQNHNIILLDL